MIRGSQEFRTRGFLTDEERSEVYINQYEFSGFENSLWALLPQAVPDKNLWKQVHVSVELDNVTSIKYGRVAVIGLLPRPSCASRLAGAGLPAYRRPRNKNRKISTFDPTSPKPSLKMDWIG